MSDVLSAVYPVLFRGDRIGEVTTQKKGAMTSFNAVMDNRNMPRGPIMRLAAVSDGARRILGVPTPEGDILRLMKTLSPLEMKRRRIGHIEYFILTEDTEDTEDIEDSEEPAAKTVPQVEENIITQAEIEDKQESETVDWQESETVLEPNKELQREYEPSIQWTERVPERVWREEYDPGRHLSDPDLKRACEDVLGAMIFERDEETLLAIPVGPSRPFPLMPVFVYGSAEKIGDSIYVVFKVKNGEIIG